MGEIYEYLNKSDGKRVFLYVVVFIIILWFFSKQKLGINILIAIIVGVFVINYLNFNFVETADTLEDILKIKKNAILPLTDETQEHKNIIDFLFSIQDLYAYCPQQFIEMVNNINYFYSYYKMTFVDPKTSFLNYTMMKQLKCDILNILTSIIFSLPEDKHVRNKLNASALVLDDIMTQHLDEISYVIDEYTYKNGYNVDTKIIDYGPKASNEYEDMFKNYGYEIF